MLLLSRPYRIAGGIIQIFFQVCLKLIEFEYVAHIFILGSFNCIWKFIVFKLADGTANNYVL
jgi:hypothetical protein